MCARHHGVDSSDSWKKFTIASSLMTAFWPVFHHSRFSYLLWYSRWKKMMETNYVSMTPNTCMLCAVGACRSKSSTIPEYLFYPKCPWCRTNLRVPYIHFLVLFMRSNDALSTSQITQSSWRQGISKLSRRALRACPTNPKSRSIRFVLFLLSHSC